MSDGNFNRALLPHTPYASGMKAGKRIARMHAVAIMRQTLKRLLPTISEEALKQEAERFDHELAQKE